MPPTPRTHVVAIAATYIDELKERVERVGVVRVAEAAGLSRQTLWRQLTAGSGRTPNPDGIERIRRALARLAPDAAMPPPLVEITGQAHHAWIGIAGALRADELAWAAAHPAEVAALVRRAARGR